MNNLKTELKNISLNNKLIMNNVNMHIQPFKQMPSINYAGQEIADRINAHDLFTLYTAEIIKADTIFVR